MTVVNEAVQGFLQQVSENAAETHHSTHVDIVVHWQHFLDELHKQPKCLMLRVLPNEEISHQIVKTLTIQETWVADSIRVEDVSQMSLQGTLPVKGPADVFVDAGEEIRRIVLDLLQHQLVVVGVGELTVGCTREQHNELLTVVVIDVQLVVVGNEALTSGPIHTIWLTHAQHEMLR